MTDMPQIERQMRIYAERRMSSTGLSFPEQRILMFLAANAPSNQDRIAQSFGIDKGSIAKSLSKLETKGLASRTLNPDNKRENIINLTAEGRAMLDEMRSVFTDWEAAIYQGISTQDIETAEAVIRTMAENANRTITEMEA